MILIACLFAGVFCLLLVCLRVCLSLVCLFHCLFVLYVLVCVLVYLFCWLLFVVGCLVGGSRCVFVGWKVDWIVGLFVLLISFLFGGLLVFCLSVCCVCFSDCLFFGGLLV